MPRRAITVRGVVQGVGFRPFVFGLACRLGLTGFVRNHSGGVHIELEGDDGIIDQFLAELTERPPPLAQVTEVRCSPLQERGDDAFRIETSAATGGEPVFIGPDVATCDACLAELFDLADRRYRYPFLNCTHCGPRLTIVREAPYDRERTTMAAFPMCAACRAEYDDPRDRRFHAQPTACPACGPRLALHGADGQPLDVAVEALRRGRIVAVKGLGGYHLACDARQEQSVAELRRRKHRDEKPFAVMVADLAAVRELAHISEPEEALLRSPRRPIVLVRRRSDAALADAVAPGNPYLGVMLPYTPLHHLLLHDLAGPNPTSWRQDSAPVEGDPGQERNPDPRGAGRRRATPAIVMTSGNQSDEPIAYEDHDALARLRGIADLFLTNDRPIHLRCDDSVTRWVGGAELPLRRSRGDAPQPLSLPIPCRRPTLAVGGQLKATFALGRDRQAFLSHHLGDLDHYEAFRACVAGIEHYERLFALTPELLVHDLHPDYASTRYALQRGRSIALLAVQHHHAHMASCMAEHGLEEPVIGVTFDGTGYGTDGTVWGGEFLVGDYRDFRRTAHLRPVPMPGGDQAIREPWRMAASHLLDAGLDLGSLEPGVPPATIRTVEKMIERKVNSPMTSSMGRLFDAVAALVGVRPRVSYEGQAAVELEWLASDVAADGHYPLDVSGTDPLIIDTRPLIAAVVRDVKAGADAARIGRRFHGTVVEMVRLVCGKLRELTGRSAIVLSGGVFLNALLTTEAVARLTEDGFRVYRHQCVPPNDGGLSLGQLAVAAARDQAR